MFTMSVDQITTLTVLGILQVTKNIRIQYIFILIKIYYFLQEIQHMLHGFGDSPRPVKETAELIEKIVKEQLIEIIRMLVDTSAKRDSNSIGIEDFLFLLRKSPVKLRRFCCYLQVRDMKKDLLKNNADNSQAEFSFSEQTKKDGNNLAAALNYLDNLDSSGFLLNVADPSKDFTLDDPYQERIERIELMTTKMDVQQYLEYSKVHN